MKKHCLLYFVFLAFIWYKAPAQSLTPLHFKSLTINDGLSQGFISHIIQDQQGFMWFATSDGLNKYDGYTFTVYHHDPADSTSIGSDDLSYLFEDSKQRLWIATRNNGIDYFDRATNTFYHIRHTDAKSISSNNIITISEDKTGALWITTSDGLDRMEILPVQSRSEKKNFFDNYKLRVTHIKADENVTEKGYNNSLHGDIFTDSRGHNFFATNSNVYELTFRTYSNYTFHKKAFLSAKDPDFMLGILEDRASGDLFINGEQIRRYQNYDFEHPSTVYEYKKTLPGHEWLIDQNHTIWTHEGDGLTCINISNNEQQYYIPADSSLKDVLRTITCMFSDRQGVLWIGTGGYGVLKYDPETERFHHILPGTRQYQLIEVQPGEILTNNFQKIAIGKEHAPVFQNVAFMQTLQQKFLNHNVLRLGADASGTVLIPDDKNIYYYNFKTKKEHVYTVSADGTGPVYPLYADKSGTLWFGLKGRFFNFTPPAGFSFIDYPYKMTEYEDDFLQNIYEDGNILWLGTIHGLFRFNMLTKHIENAYYFRLNDNSSLSNNYVYCFCNDIKQPDRYLWIGTKGGGLNRMDKLTGKFIRFNTKDGLPNNVVYGILPGDDGNLWLSTNKGLSAFNPETKVFRNYNEEDGLQSNEFNRYSYCKMSDGVLVFGGMNGINYFDPKDIQPLQAPLVNFTGFRLFNKPVNIKDPDAPLHENINYLKGIKLKYKQNVLTFQFAAMDYRREGNIHYRYKMKGFDKDWVYSGITHEATYTNLDPGKYEFIVQGSFDNMLWGQAKKSIPVIILTPWYRTWWFYFLLALVILSMMYGLYKFRVNQIRRVMKLRNRIARDLHDEVGSSISTISIYSKIIQEQMNSDEFDKRPLIDKINIFAREIMESMNDIVWNINTNNDAFERIISKMREHALQLLEPKGYSVHFDFDDTISESSLSMEKRKEFYFIYKETLNNIAKYACGKNVWISLKLLDDVLMLTIQDDGKGFDKDSVRANGNGLNNLKYRSEILRGNLTVNSETGKGTQVHLSFNIN